MKEAGCPDCGQEDTECPQCHSLVAIEKKYGVHIGCCFNCGAQVEMECTGIINKPYIIEQELSVVI